MRQQLIDQGYVLRSGWNDAIEHSFEVWYNFSADEHVSYYATYFKQEHRNSAGLAHGGMLAAFLDHCMGSMCWRISGGNMGWTTAINLQFLRPARINRWIFAKIEHAAGIGSTVLLNGTLYQDRVDGHIVAQGQGTFSIRRPAKKEKDQ